MPFEAKPSFADFYVPKGSHEFLWFARHDLANIWAVYLSQINTAEQKVKEIDKIISIECFGTKIFEM